MQIVQQLKFFYTWPWILIFFLAGAFLLFSVTQKTLRHRFLISFVFYDLLLQIRKWRNLRVLVICFKPNLYLCFWFCMSGLLRSIITWNFPKPTFMAGFLSQGLSLLIRGWINHRIEQKKYEMEYLHCFFIVSSTNATRFYDWTVCGGDWGPIFKVRLNFSADDRGTKGEGGRGWYWKCVKKTKNDKKAKTAKKKNKRQKRRERLGIGKVFRAGIGKKPNPGDHYGRVNGHQGQISQCYIHQYCQQW